MKTLLLLLLGASALISFGGLHARAEAPNPAAIAVQRNDWLVRHRGFNAIAQKGGVDLLFVGDSITDAWRKTGQAEWTRRFEPLKAANFGISGDKTEHVLWRLRNGNLDGIQPKALMLMIGTNNTDRDTAAQIAEGIGAIVAEIQKRSPATKILLLGIFPRSEKPDAAVRTKIAEINRLLAGMDDGQKVFFLDIGDKFLEPDGSLSRKIMPDLLHLSPAGYTIWADAVEPKLKELLNQPSPAPLKAE